MTRIFPAALLVLMVVLAACSGNDTGDADAHADHVEEQAEAAQTDVHADGKHQEQEPASTRIAAEIAAASGIKIAPAAAGIIADEHEVQGLLTPVEGRVAHATARFPGPIRALRANVGDRVRAGQVLAVIESNLSLSNYTVTAPRL